MVESKRGAELPAGRSSSRTAGETAPYRGLRYYRPDQEHLFASRVTDVDKCIEIFQRASVLILHGTTGCGKSSFLRAGLKPRIEKIKGGAVFAEDEGELQVVRSGEDPLGTLARHVYDKVKACCDARQSNPQCEMYGGRIESDIERALLGCSDAEAFVQKVKREPEALVDAIETFSGSVVDPPAIVVDQAEEMFTLNLRPRQKPGEHTKPRELSAAEVERVTLGFFEFLARFASRRLDIKVVVSLRTEYKGQFDDLIQKRLDASDERPSIYGYHLPELDRAGLIEAIKKPAGVAPHEFSFENGVPEEIADLLLAEPMAGGRLPVLQVACLLLWKRVHQLRVDTARRLRKKASQVPWQPISKREVYELGSFRDQIDEYVKETIHEMGENFQETYLRAWGRPGEPASDSLLDPSERADRWMLCLHETLVDPQPDGRAVTKRVSHEDMIEAAKSYLSGRVIVDGDPNIPSDEVCAKSLYASELDWLSRDESGLLRKDASASPTSWLLGHDAIGLALERWRRTYAPKRMGMLKMEMNMPREYVARDGQPFELFEKDEKPPNYRILIPADPMWDRHLLDFAKSLGLAARLGLDLQNPPAELQAIEDGQETGRTWADLISNLDRKREAGEIVICLAERDSISASTREEWFDIAISDVFVGNALIGPRIKLPDGTDLEALSQHAAVSDPEQKRARSAKALEGIIRYLHESHSQIICADETSENMMQLAAEKWGGKRFPKNQVDSSAAWNIRYSVRDYMFDRAWSDNEELEDGDGKPRTFFVGTDYGRAAAKQTGMVTYFGIDDLELLDVGLLKDRRLTSHTVWNLACPDEAFGSAEGKKAFVLRLASLAYFVSEYVRSAPDEFVRFVHDKHRDLHERGGFRLGRDSVREVMEECYNFHRFEDHGRLFYRKSSRWWYWLNNDANSKKDEFRSRDIYFELCALRQESTQLFDELEWKLADLEGKGATEAVYAKRLIDVAWNNYLVFNFFDSSRLLRKARGVVESL